MFTHTPTQWIAGFTSTPSSTVRTITSSMEGRAKCSQPEIRSRPASWQTTKASGCEPISKPVLTEDLISEMLRQRKAAGLIDEIQFDEIETEMPDRAED